MFMCDDDSKRIVKKELMGEMEQNIMQEIKMQNTFILFKFTCTLLSR